MFVLVTGGLLVTCTGLFLAAYYNTYKAFPTADKYFTHDTFKFQYEMHCDRGWREAPATSQLDFKNFIHLMSVNPDRWEWNSESMRLYYRHREDDHIQVIFSKKDFLKFRKWLFQQSRNGRKLERYKADTNNCQIILETAQKDIDRIKELARAQVDEAKDIVDNINNDMIAHSVLYTDGANNFYTRKDGKFIQLEKVENLTYEPLA